MYLFTKAAGPFLTKRLRHKNHEINIMQVLDMRSISINTFINKRHETSSLQQVFHKVKREKIYEPEKLYWKHLKKGFTLISPKKRPFLANF